MPSAKPARPLPRPSCSGCPSTSSELSSASCPSLFRPISSAHFPYYHAYVLLHSRSLPDMKAIVEAMKPADRETFLDDLPEEAWNHLMDEIESAEALAESAAETTVETVSEPQDRSLTGHLEETLEPVETEPAEGSETIAVQPAEAEPIIEARQVEKSFRQPEGRMIQVIAPPTSHSKPAPSPRCSGLRVRANPRCCACSRGWRHPRPEKFSGTGQPMSRMPSQRRHRLPELRAVSVAHRAGKRGSAAAGARHGASRAPPRRRCARSQPWD